VDMAKKRTKSDKAQRQAERLEKKLERRSIPSTGKLRRFGSDQGDCTQYPNILRQPEGICRDLSDEELFRLSLVLISGVIYGEDH
jgi:hypothetical protein